MASLSNDRLQYLVLGGTSLLVFGFVVILYIFNGQIFQRFIGRINPLLAFLLVIILGFVLLSFLLSQTWFAIYERENLTGLVRSAGLAALFGVVMIAMDTRIVFPADTNILFPESLLFYPAIGFLAEILFHVLPLTLLLVLLNSLFKQANFGTLVWVSIFAIAMVEPVYHMMDMAASHRYPVWAVVFVGVHVFLINFCQLYIFRTYDFMSMYAFRLVYYLFWHIGWGYLRLRLLF